MNWEDVVAAILLIVAAIIGLRRGFWAEAILLVGVGLALVTSAWLTPKLSPWLPGQGTFFFRALSAILFIVIFLIFSGIYLWLGGKTREWVPEQLRPADRVAGIVMGVLKGSLLAGLFFLVLIQPAAPVSWRVGARDAVIAPMALSVDAVVVEALARPLPVLRPFSRMLSESIQKLHTTASGAVVVAPSSAQPRAHA